MLLWKSYISVLNNKWQYDTSQDWDVLGQDLERFSTICIAEGTFFTLCLYISTIEYLKDRAPCFIGITGTEADLDCRLMQRFLQDNCGQVIITDFKKEVARKKNKRVLKKKAQTKALCRLAVFCIKFPPFLLPCPLPTSAVSHSESPRLPCARSSALLLPYILPTPTFLLFCTMLTPTFWLFCIMPAPVFFLPYVMFIPAFLLPCIISTPALLSLCPMLILALLLHHPVSSTLITFKKSLSDKLWPRVSTSLTQLFC